MLTNKQIENTVNYKKYCHIAHFIKYSTLNFVPYIKSVPPFQCNNRQRDDERKPNIYKWIS